MRFGTRLSLLIALACIVSPRGMTVVQQAPRQQGFQAVIFDVGNVLRLNFVERKLADLARKYRLDAVALMAVRDQFRDRADLGAATERQFWNDILKPFGVTPTEPDMAIAEYFQPVPGTLDIARALKSRYKLAILSNDSYESSAIGIALYRFDEVFDYIAISAYEGKKKPDSLDFYRVPATRLGVPPERCVFVDDRPVNVQAARTVGMYGIVFESAAQLRRSLAEVGISVDAGGK
jgi:putative hydrolase of the HAD superfamily